MTIPLTPGAYERGLADLHRKHVAENFELELAQLGDIVELARRTHPTKVGHWQGRIDVLCRVHQRNLRRLREQAGVTHTEDVPRATTPAHAS